MKILMAGLGGAGQRLLRHLREHAPEKTQFGAWRVRRRREVITRKLTVDRRRDVGRFYNLESFRSLEEGLAWRPDAVVIANPTAHHLPTALAAVKAGCHVLVEKPLSHSRDGLDELQSVAEQKGRVVLVGYMFRFHPQLKRVAEILRSGRLGRPLWAHFEAGSYVPDWHPYEDWRELYAVREELGGGVVLTESHELDLAAWWFGAPRRISAMGGPISGKSKVEDTASLLMDCGFPVHVNLCFFQRPPARGFQIACDQGRIEWDGQAFLRVFDADRGAWSESTEAGYDRDHLFRDEVKHFLACVQGKERPTVDLAAARVSLETALVALDQIRSRS